MSPFPVGLALTVLLLPYSVWALRRAGRRVDAIVANPGLAPVLPFEPRESAPLVAASTDSPSGPDVVARPRLAVAPALSGAAPGLPDVTPVLAGVEKAGQVRRGQGPPCHDCHCCDVYGTRIKSANGEIDRLRDEILARDVRGVRVAAQLQSGHGQSR